MSTATSLETRYVNHYGFGVYSDTPVTGVFSNNSLEYIFEDCDLSGVDPDYQDAWEEALRTQQPGEELSEDWFNDGYQQSRALIGFRLNLAGEWEPDPNAEYSAIVSFDGMNICQVVASKWRIRGALCSPCCPGQVDADTEGEFLAYSVPPNVVGGEGEPEYDALRSRIFPAEQGEWVDPATHWDEETQTPR